MNEPPQSLFEDPELSDLVRALRQEGPSRASRERILRGLSGGGPGGGGAGRGVCPPRVLVMGGITSAATLIAIVYLLATVGGSSLEGGPKAEAKTVGEDTIVEVESAPRYPMPSAGEPNGASAPRDIQRQRVPRPTVPAVEGVARPTEEELILRARQALPSAPGRATALLREHARDYPNGVLVEEREALLIDTAFARGDASHAAERLAAFRSRYPRSPHRARLSQRLEQNR